MTVAAVVATAAGPGTRRRSSSSITVGTADHPSDTAITRAFRTTTDGTAEQAAVLAAAGSPAS